MHGSANDSPHKDGTPGTVRESPADDVTGRTSDAMSDGPATVTPREGAAGGTRWEPISAHALPAFLNDNEYLLKHHRPQLKSFRQCFHSLFRLHTETGNIWTHLIGSLLFLTLAVVYWVENAQTDITRCMLFSIYFIGTILATGISCLYHIIICHSEPVCRLMAKLDYCGVISLTACTFIPYLYYAFYWRPAARLAYSALILLLSAAAVSVILQEKFSRPGALQGVRAVVFVALGLTGVIPFVHYVLVCGAHRSLPFLPPLLGMALMYVAGAGFYASKLPERMFPGSFDLWFQSHQIMHVLMIIGSVLALLGMHKLATYVAASGTEFCSDQYF